VAGPPPDQPYEVSKPPPGPWGVVRPPLKGLETKKKKKSLGFGALGVAGPPTDRPYGVVETTPKLLGHP
jgi:hypothetical protein